MYDSPSGAGVGMPQREPTPLERVIGDLEQLNRRLDNYAGAFQGIADRWHGPQPRSVADERGQTMHAPPPAPPIAPGLLAQLEAQLRAAHAIAQAIENQLDRLRSL